MGILIEVIAGAMRDPDMTVDETTASGMGIRETGMEMIDIVTEMTGMF